MEPTFAVRCLHRFFSVSPSPSVSVSVLSSGGTYLSEGALLPAASCLQPAWLLAFAAAFLCMAWPNKALTEEPTGDLVAKIQRHYDQIQSLRADFTQETRSRAASLGTSGSGKFYFLKPQAMRWDYEEPKQRFVINEEQAWLYVPEEKTIFLYEVERLLSSPLVLNFFSGLGRLRETFRITQLPAESGPPMLYRLELLPREEEPSVSRVILWVDATSYLVVRIETEDPLGGVNQISLRNIQVGIPLDRSWFALQIPEGFRVERQQAAPSK